MPLDPSLVATEFSYFQGIFKLTFGMLRCFLVRSTYATKKF